MKYRMKPIVIEAIQWDGRNRVEVAKFVKGGKLKDNETILLPGSHIFIDTLDGRICASINDWIIKGIKGEFYLRKPDIFKEIYDPVE